MGNAASSARSKTSKKSKASSKKDRHHHSHKKGKKGKSHSHSHKKDKKELQDCGETVETNLSTDKGGQDDKWILKMLDGVPEGAPEELKVVREWIHKKNMHDVDGMAEMCHPDTNFCFVDSETFITLQEWNEIKKLIYGSFPDLHFFWKCIRVAGTSQWGVDIVLEDYYGIGTHTGKPFGFGPYEPIPPTGLTVQDEYIEFTISVKDGKISRACIDAFGQMVGPPGFYTKIGGMIM